VESGGARRRARTTPEGRTGLTKASNTVNNQP
jgi:hypothetical protein